MACEVNVHVRFLCILELGLDWRGVVGTWTCALYSILVRPKKHVKKNEPFLMKAKLGIPKGAINEAKLFGRPPTQP